MFPQSPDVNKSTLLLQNPILFFLFLGKRKEPVLLFPATSLPTATQDPLLKGGDQQTTTPDVFFPIFRPMRWRNHCLDLAFEKY